MKSFLRFASVCLLTCLFSSCEKVPDLTYGSSYEDDVICVEPEICQTEFGDLKRLGYHLTNKSDKTIKYFEVCGTLCDHWGKELYVNGSWLSANIIAVGPIEPEETLFYMQNNYINVSAAEQVLIKVIRVEYTDGSLYYLR